MNTKGKGKHGAATSHSAGGKGKGKANASGKSKHKVSTAADDSDSSFETRKPGLKNGRGSTRRYDDVGEDEVDGDDEYVVRTDHLADGSG